MKIGTLVIVVLEARNLPNKVRIGKQNPYATLKYGLHTKRTKTVERGGQVPEWDEEFRFDIFDDKKDSDDEELIPEVVSVVNRAGGVLPVPDKAKFPAGSPRTTGGKKILRLACYADDPRDPTLIGETSIDLEPIIKKGMKDDWFPLEKKAHPAGEVKIEFTFYSDAKPPSPKPVAVVARAESAYGGAGSRVSDAGDSDDEEDGALELDANYPDADVGPLSNNMATLSVASSLAPIQHGQPQRSTSPYYESPGQPNPYNRRVSGSSSYGPLPTPTVHQQPPPPPQQVYGGGGEYQAMAQQHYAAQSYASQPAPTPTPFHNPYAPSPSPSQWGAPAPPQPPQLTYPPTQSPYHTVPPSSFTQPPPSTVYSPYNPYNPSATPTFTPPPTTFSPPPIPPSFYPPPTQPQLSTSNSFSSFSSFAPPPPPPPELLASTGPPPQHSYSVPPPLPPQPPQQPSPYYQSQGYQSNPTPSPYPSGPSSPYPQQPGAPTTYQPQPPSTYQPQAPGTYQPQPPVPPPHLNGYAQNQYPQFGAPLPPPTPPTWGGYGPPPSVPSHLNGGQGGYGGTTNAGQYRHMMQQQQEQQGGGGGRPDELAQYNPYG